MPIYEIELPNGKTLEIEGDRFPTETELDEIVKNLDSGASEENPLNKSPLTPLERIKMGFGDRQGNYDYLKNKYGEGNVKPDGNSFIVKTDKGWQQTDPSKITDLPMDVLEILLPTAVDTTAQLGGAALGGMVGNIPGIIAGGASGAALGDAINQGIGNALETRNGYDKGEGLLSAVLGGSIPAVAPAVGAIKNKLKVPIAKGAMKVAQKINSPEFIDNFAKLQQLLTSVPENYTKKALQAELDGKSILTDGKAVNSAYDNIVKNLRDAKTTIKPTKYYSEQFNEIAQKAKEALQNLQEGYDTNFTTMLGKIDNPKEFLSPEEYLKLIKSPNYKPIKLNGNDIEQDLIHVINQYANGATVNKEKMLAGKTFEQVLNEFKAAKEAGLKLQDLHNLKEFLYEKANYEAGGQAGIKGLAEKLNSILRNYSKEYAEANDKYAKLKSVEKESTLNPENKLDNLAEKLSQLHTDKAIMSGLYNKFKLVDDLLPKKDKFLDKAIDVLKQKEQDINLMKEIGKKRFEKTPKSLGHLTDAEDEALETIQKRYNKDLPITSKGIDILDDLENANINEALNRWMPGQGGGSGSEQGAANLVRSAIAGGAVTGGAMKRNPLLILAGMGFSPKFGTKKAIQNLGKINNKAQSIMENVLDQTPIENSSLKNKAYQAVIHGLLNRKNKPTVLYGGVSNLTDDYTNYDTNTY